MSNRTIVICDICDGEQIEAKSVYLLLAISEQFVGERKTYGMAHVCLDCQKKSKIFRILVDKLKLQ